MLKFKCLLLFSQLVVFSNCIAQDNKLIEKTIFRFYNEYVNNFQNLEISNLDSVRKEFSTDCLLNDLSITELDFDPYINAQDCDSTLLKTLKISFHKNNTVVIHYGEGKYRQKILMKLVMSDGKWLIGGLKLGKEFKLGCW